MTLFLPPSPTVARFPFLDGATLFHFSDERVVVNHTLDNKTEALKRHLGRSTQPPFFPIQLPGRWLARATSLMTADTWRLARLCQNVTFKNASLHAYIDSSAPGCKRIRDKAYIHVNRVYVSYQVHR